MAVRRGARWLALGALTLAPGLLPSAAAAEPPPEVANPHLGEAIRHIEAGELEAALRALEAALTFPENTNRILVEVYRNLAIVYLYSGDEAGAYEAFARLLNIDPDYTLPPHTAEPVAALFERVREAYAKGLLEPVRVAVDPIEATPSGVPASLVAVVSGLRPDMHVRAYYRLAGTASWNALELEPRPGNRYVASLPAFTADSGGGRTQVEYYVEVSDAAGRRVQGAGSALEPLRFAVLPPAAPPPPPAPPPWYENGWVWAAVGVVALGAGA
ncbi:MAG: hypothetical protein D6729_19760, partial [Deltaproteobacteria bacterium]